LKVSILLHDFHQIFDICSLTLATVIPSRFLNAHFFKSLVKSSFSVTSEGIHFFFCLYFALQGNWKPSSISVVLNKATLQYLGSTIKTKVLNSYLTCFVPNHFHFIVIVTLKNFIILIQRCLHFSISSIWNEILPKFFSNLTRTPVKCSSSPAHSFLGRNSFALFYHELISTMYAAFCFHFIRKPPITLWIS